MCADQRRLEEAREPQEVKVFLASGNQGRSSISARRSNPERPTPNGLFRGHEVITKEGAVNKRMPVGLVLSACVAVAQMWVSPQASAQDAKGLRVVSDQTVSGFTFPESVAYDPKA